MTERVYIYDTTLRDGAQTQGVDFTVVDKQNIARALDELGIDYIEGGWPGANPTDDAFFEQLPKLKHSTMIAFGKTRKAGASAKNDPGLNALLNSEVKGVCLVGKSWDFHVKKALEIPLKENIKMVEESVVHAVSKRKEVVFDAEHFFDGYKANPEYALKVVQAAYEAGARWVVLCDTNGGSLPHEIEEIVREVVVHVPGDHLGIHCHNDTENAVANSLAAVKAGVRQVQGTINGLGERCGNANLTSIIPNLILKMGYETGVSEKQLKRLTKVSRMLAENLNQRPNPYAPYVGSAAFAHKGGLHVSAVAKDPRSYEHIDPGVVGNQRNIVVSDQAGKANIISRLKEIGIKINVESKATQEKISDLVAEIKRLENKGYSYDSANASFELLARRSLGKVPRYFKMEKFVVTDERRWEEDTKLVVTSLAVAAVRVGDKLIKTKARGKGPVNALDKALRKALAKKYPELKDIKLIDYKVRILNPEKSTEAVTRVIIESEDSKGRRWTTLGVSANVLDASYNALRDSITYKLLRG